MTRPKSKSAVGLGNTLMNDRFGRGRGFDRRKASAVTRTNHATGEQYVTNDKSEASWVKMRSITEQGALDEFLMTAELADTDFTAEKMNSIKIIHTGMHNPYLLSTAEETEALKKHQANHTRLTVPRRPPWKDSTTPQELDTIERESFLRWRRGLADLQENHDLLMTPFERNLEVWRQLWRVLEKSDLVVQIVDARNPLLFRSEDLEAYVREVHVQSTTKKNLLLINKADMMTSRQRTMWADYLKGAGIPYKFFSANLARERNEADQEGDSRDDEDDSASDGESVKGVEDMGENIHVEAEVILPRHVKKDGAKDEDADEDEDEDEDEKGDGDGFEDGNKNKDEGIDEGEDEDIRILTVEELEDVFLSHIPADLEPGAKMHVGLVGYPNVGKSSTINALIGAKKVSVSSTPGKTKHFQTIHLSDRIILCDCPGLVFPNFATTKAELVCNGILPIDQLREYIGPVGLVTQRIPRAFLEAIYGIQIQVRPLDEGGTGIPTARELLSAYARARGFTTQGMGEPDTSRAARYVLKDYVNGRLLYCVSPPTFDDAANFNSELFDICRSPRRRKAARSGALALPLDTTASASATPNPSKKTESIDQRFFKPGQGSSAGHATMPFNHVYTERGLLQSGKMLSGRKARTMLALDKGLDPATVKVVSSKKHFKAGVKGKAKIRGALTFNDE